MPVIIEERPLAYTVSGFCQIVGISKSGAYRLFKSGVITPRKAGHRTLILRADVEAWLTNLPQKRDSGKFN
jgi:excisionase family DNA binding protein